MKHTSLLAATIALLPLTLHAQFSSRVYHDSIRTLSDTIIALPSPASDGLRAAALEMRGRMPKADIGSPLQAIGILWDINPEKDRFNRASIRPLDPMPDEVMDSRSIEFRIERHTPSGDSLILKNRLRNGFGLGRAANTLGIEIDLKNGETVVYGGDGEPVEIARITTLPPKYPTMGIQAEGEAEISLLVTEWMTDPSEKLKTSWTIETLREYLGRAKAPEGFYHYLDRLNDPRYCRMGGTYSLALVRNLDGGFDIIYVGGAQTGAEKWETGMLKGRLEPTIFENHYDLIWFDAMMESLSAECSAEIEQNAILSLSFPLLKSSVRYSLRPQDK